jgi:hypothetical protein
MQARQTVKWSEESMNGLRVRDVRQKDVPTSTITSITDRGKRPSDPTVEPCVRPGPH